MQRGFKFDAIVHHTTENPNLLLQLNRVAKVSLKTFHVGISQYYSDVPFCDTSFRSQIICVNV